MGPATLAEEWAMQPDDYARAFGDIEGYVHAFRAIMERFGVGFGSVCWFDQGAEAEDDPTVQEWLRHTVNVLKPDAEHLDHYIVYAADLMFMEGDLDEAWRSFTAVPRDYVKEAFHDVPVAMGDEKLILVQEAYGAGLPAVYLRDAPMGLRSSSFYGALQRAVRFWNAGVPVEYAAQMWETNRLVRQDTHMDILISCWEHNLPAEYASALIGDMPVPDIAASYRAGLPAEYARAAYSENDRKRTP